jgi:hypothetical protein
MPIGNFFVNGESTAYDNGNRVTGHSKRDNPGQGMDGFASECLQDTALSVCKNSIVIVPRVSNIMSQLAFTNLTDSALNDLDEGYIKGMHQEAAKFCAQQSQYQQGKEEVRKELDKTNSDEAASSLLPSSYTPTELSKYHFPSETDLARCLDKNRLIRGNVIPRPDEAGYRSYLDGKGLVQGLVKEFANEVKAPEGVANGVTLIKNAVNHWFDQLDPVRLGLADSIKKKKKTLPILLKVA